MGFAQGKEKMENENAEYWCNKGNEFCGAKNYEGATECYEKVIQLEPENATAFHNLGIAFYNLAENKKDKEREDLLNSASEKYEKTTQLDPKNASVFHNWGLALSKLAEINKSQKILWREEYKVIENDCFRFPYHKPIRRI
jgi:tetratricopeptide (TPR) repeat protein